MLIGLYNAELKETCLFFMPKELQHENGERKAEKTLIEPPSINHLPEVRERKLRSGEKVTIPAANAKLEREKKNRGRLERRGVCRIHATRKTRIRSKISTSRKCL